MRHLAVLDGRRLAGVLSDRDLGGRAAALTGRTVGDLMTGGAVVTGSPDTTVRQAANLLRGRNIGCLPIVDRQRPVGMVTVSDLLELLGRGATRPATERQRWTLRRRGPGRTFDQRKKGVPR